METQAKPLDVGEKFLSISVLGQIKLTAFPNKNKKNSTDPDYTGNGVAVWINTKKAKQEKEAEIPVQKL